MIRVVVLALGSVLIGVVCGLGAVSVALPPVASVAEPPGFSEELLSCAAEVDTAGWTSYQNRAYAFALKFPPQFSMRDLGDRLELRPADGSFPIIAFWKERATLGEAMNRAPYQLAGYKVADRQSFVLASPYFSETLSIVTSTYLFFRNFLKEGAGAPLTVVRAVIRDDALNPVFGRARERGIADVESVLTPAEQILSTFRFLTNSELYGT